MKLFFSLIFLIVLIGANVKADSFSIIKDGKNYLCTQTDIPNNGGEIDCGNKAYAGPFSKNEAVRLCTGAQNTDPADCAIKAYSGAYGREESISLCRRTVKGTGPAECGFMLYSGPFNTTEGVNLCSRTGTIEVANCALSAVNGPYSNEEAIRLCRNNPGLVLRLLK